jgi:hypothetical protein
VAGLLARISDARRIQLVWSVYIVAFVLFVFSLLEPAMSTIENYHGRDRSALHELAGWQFLLFGPLGIFAGPQFGWYANPLMLLSALPLKRSLKIMFAILAILLAVSSVTLTSVPVLDVAYRVRFARIGFYLWLACPVLVLFAAFLAPDPGEDEQIKLVSDNEGEVILEVAQDAAKRLRWPQIGKDRSTNALLPTILSLKRRQNLNYGKYSSIGKLINYCSPRSISREDLVILAPYIDDWLSGNISLCDLPAEYDPRNERLRAFKRRLLCSGDWPDERAMKEAKPRPA